MILQLQAKFETTMVPCLIFLWITNSSDHKRVWTTNLWHAMHLNNLFIKSSGGNWNLWSIKILSTTISQNKMHINRKLSFATNLLTHVFRLPFWDCVYILKQEIFDKNGSLKKNRWYSTILQDSSKPEKRFLA